MIRPKVTLKERTNPGAMRKFASDMGGLARITLGVQGAEAKEQHPESTYTVGELAAAHELGLGVQKRSWLVSWMDANQDAMMRQARSALSGVLAGRKTYRAAAAALGQDWVAGLQKNILDGKVTPPLADSTIARKGHGIPLLRTRKLVGAITFSLKVPRVSAAQARRAAAFALRR